MSPARFPLFRSTAISSWLVVAVLAVSLFTAMSIAHADDYDTCMVSCKASGGSSRGCHDDCK